MSEPRHVTAPEDVTDVRAPLLRRFVIYQAERFPLLGLAPLVTLFAFSSVAYSRRARGAPGFVDAGVFAVGAFTAVTIFFLLRVLDEHKDATADLCFRPELPVPRGLISLAELRRIGTISALAALIANLVVAPVLLAPLVVVAAWATLMTREFFVPAWLRAHPAAYLLTHMAIMPLIDGYTTGIDWLRAGAQPPHGLGLFLVVTFMNGILIEIGRKIRAPEDERPGVDTYTSAWGRRVAPLVWLLALAASATLAWRAASFTATTRAAGFALAIAVVPCAWPALGFLRRRSRAFARQIDVASQVWPAVTYLVLGALPWALAALRRS